MKAKTPRIVVTFHTTAEAIATEKLCQRLELAGKLISAPRALSADCGIAWSAPPESGDRLLAVLRENGIEYEGFHRLEL